MRIVLPIALLLAATATFASERYNERADVRAFVADVAERNGLDADVLLAHFRKVKHSAPVLKAIKPPTEPGARSWQAYRERFVDTRRITHGLEFWRDHEIALVRAQALYGVPAEVIVAIIGVETIYGRHTGEFDVFNALANLAFDYPPRAELFRGELEALLLLARDEQRNPWRYRGSYAGALGLPQFLPSSIRNYAVDFDRDGRIDLARSADDAIGSVANFLYQHGWENGETIALPAKVSSGGMDGPESSPAPLVAEGLVPKRLPTEMTEYGVVVEGAPEKPAALVDLPTPNMPTEYRLGYNNFYVLTRYNRSAFYAAAVMDLAETLRAARPPVPGPEIQEHDMEIAPAPAAGLQ
jgi:membrane-bound lytic murein transglycosylase B